MPAPSETIVYPARRILTLNPAQPFATHVAVRDGRILGVGDAAVAETWGGGRTDDRFRDAVLLPGFVEAHSHLLTGALWDFTYAGYLPRRDPEGRLWPGITEIGGLQQRLGGALAEKAPGQPLIVWGFDPLFFAGERLNRHHLDAIAADRPVAVLHASLHLMTVNSAALDSAGLTPATQAEGVLRLSDGSLSGELQEMAAMFPVMRRLNIQIREMARGERAALNFAAEAVRAGVTTATDLFADITDEDVAALTDLTGRADFPLRLVPALNVLALPPAEAAARALELRARSTDRLRLGRCKLMTDGSIQGYTARVKWPGYVNGIENGLWNIEPGRLYEIVRVLHAAGLNLQIHTNGDEASEVALDAIAAALAAHPRGDHRHTLQHCQMAGEDQFFRARQLGVCVNLFANHLWYFGDAHYEATVGPDRAARMNACRAALDQGLTLAVHSDSPVTPLGPLHVAWCAVNRVTPKGRVLGEAQRLTVPEALHAITLGPARTLHLDAEIGSIVPGKRADFAVLADDPLDTPPEALRDIAVLGTVQGGRVFLP